MAPALPPRANAREPVIGSKILVFKPQWLALVLSGKKILGVRAQCYKAGRYYLGAHGTIYAEAQLGHGIKVENERHWRRLQPKHLHSSRKMPYKKNTFVIPIESVREIRRPYRHPQGAISIVRYVPP